MIHYSPETGYRDSENRKGVPAGGIPGQAIPVACARIRLPDQQIHGKILHETQQEGMTFAKGVPCDEKPTNRSE
jgi:hypothetical protein